jgi:fengycin family lipopeptide synthetase D
VDRKALPDVDTVRPEMDREYVEPRDDMEIELATVWQEVLGVGKVGIYDNFFDLGGHSLLIMKVLARLKLLYPVTVQDFFDHQTIAALSDIISHRTAAGDESVQGLIVEEDTDAPVPVDIPLSGRKEHPKGILLTGATGYLGAHLLNTFLDQTDADIYCLVRGESLDHITERLKATVKFYFGERKALFSRILPIPGDIGVDGLQLDGPAKEKILNEVDTIVHAAADVRHFGEYAQFENINVLGTKRVLALAESGRCERFHYVSTLSVSGDYIPNKSKVLFREKDFSRGQVLENVYARSKYAAEELVRASMADGLPATIFRVGNLVGTWETGKFQRSIDTSAFYGFMKAIAVMGLVPEFQSDMDMTPVDTCSTAITRLMLFPETINQTLHLFNPNLVSLNELAEQFRSFGYGMEALSAAEYMDVLDQYQKGEVSGEAFEKLVPLFAGSLSPQTKIIYDCSVANHFLEAAKFNWPIPDRGFIHKLIAYCVSIGFMDAPELLK